MLALAVRDRRSNDAWTSYRAKVDLIASKARSRNSQSRGEKVPGTGRWFKRHAPMLRHG